MIWTATDDTNATRDDGYRIHASAPKGPEYAASVYGPDHESIGMIWRTARGRWVHSLQRIPTHLQSPAFGWATSAQAADALIAAYQALP